MLCHLAHAGAGVLVLPYNFAATGAALGCVLLAVLAAATAYSLHALAEVRRIVCVTSYAGCVRALLGVRAARMLDGFQIVYMAGALVAMLRIVLDQLEAVAPSSWLATVLLLWLQTKA